MSVMEFGCNYDTVKTNVVTMDIFALKWNFDES